MRKHYEINAPVVISEPMDEELVVINLENGCYYNLNRTAAQLWNYLEQGCSLDKIIHHMSMFYGSEENVLLSDFTSLVQRLTDEQLIRVTEGMPINEIPLKKATGQSYLKPNFEKYSDMQEMLLLDPIHEVSDAGWPHQKK